MSKPSMSRGITEQEVIQGAHTESAIVVQNLGKQVAVGGSSLTILSDIGFSVMRGETLAIVGRSGSGKTTLLGLIAGLDVPSDGEIHLLGHRISAMDEDQRADVRAQHVGFVFQNFQLIPSLNALQNVMLPLELRKDRQAREQATQYLAHLGLGDRLTHFPAQLSGGEQQRVALARAFVSHPDILFADEPTGNLDAETGARIIDLMFRLNAEQGTTLVLVTHDEQLAARCQRRIVVDSGKLIRQDTESVSC